MTLLAPLFSARAFRSGRSARLRALAAIRTLFGDRGRAGTPRRVRAAGRTLLEVERLDQRIALSASRQYPAAVPLPGLSTHFMPVPRPAAAVSLAPAARIAAVSAPASSSVSVTPSSVTVPTPTTATVITLTGTGYTSSTFNGYVKLTSVSTTATPTFQQFGPATAAQQVSPDSEDWNITLPVSWKPLGSSQTNTKFFIQLCPDPSAGTLYPAVNSAANTVTFAPLPVPSVTSLSASKG
ncbi:MAG: hypothetical protein ACKOTB_07550, partial [Planctomycetia bacterium]